MELTLIIIGTAVLIANIWATIVVARSPFAIKERKVFQIIFIWCIPIIGASMAIFFNTENKRTSKTNKHRVSLKGDVALSELLESDNHSGSDH